MYVYDYNHHYDDCVYVNPKYFVIKKQQTSCKYLQLFNRNGVTRSRSRSHRW